MRLMVLLLSLSIHPMVSHANLPDAEFVEPAPLRTADERVTDGIGLVFATAGLTLAGGGLGYLLGRDECDSDGFICIPTSVGFMVLGGSVALFSGPDWHDRWTDGP